MRWNVRYHPAVARDLKSIGAAEARSIMRVIDQRIQHGEPDKVGKSLSGDLAGCCRIRTGDTRIIYRVDSRVHEVIILAVGMRRREEVYRLALGRR